MKKLKISLIIILLLILISLNSFVLASEQNNNPTVINDPNQTVQNGTNTTNTTNNLTSIPNATNTGNNVYNNDKLPQTGSEDYIILFFVAFAISAIYAYKKIRDYKDL